MGKIIRLSSFIIALIAAIISSTSNASASSSHYEHQSGGGIKAAGKAPLDALKHLYKAEQKMKANKPSSSSSSSAFPSKGGAFPNTPLDDYVYQDDGAFEVTDLKTSYEGLGYKVNLYNFTSQKWLTPADSSRHIWYHILAVIIPDNVNTQLDSSLLYITGGNNRDGWVPKVTDTDLIIAAALATGANSTAAVLFQVPNQGITFPSDPWQKGSRSEDSAIAFTWWHYTQFPNQPEWVLELPMTKAGVKALDALQMVVPQYIGGNPINKFIVAGASKRGWTTWLVGAAEANRGVNNRILAIIPIVLDALHMHSFMHRHYTSLGGWSFALRDYVQANITVELDSVNLNNMFTFIDAYFLRDRLTMPKFVINAGGDEFQLPDDHRYWGNDMLGETKFLLVKNAEHSMITGIFEIIPAITSYVVSIQAGASRPTVQWSINNATGAIFVTTSEPPDSVQIAFTDSPLGPSKGRRDFRWAALNVEPCISIFGGCLRPIFWGTTKEYINSTTPTSFEVLMPLVPDHFRVFTLEVRFKNPLSKDEFLFTVPASVIPNIYPFPDCHGVDCGTNLV